MKGWIIPVGIVGALLAGGLWIGTQEVDPGHVRMTVIDGQAITQQYTPPTQAEIEQMTPEEILAETERLLNEMIELQREINELQRSINETEELMLKYKTGKAWSA